MKDSDQNLKNLFCEARAAEPFGLPRNYGFETRLKESIRNAEPATLDFFGALCWRFSLVWLPVVIPAIVAIGLLNSSLMPGGISSAFSICSDLFSLDTLSKF